MSSVYIVVGTTGEYDFYVEWNVKAFLDPARAAALAETLNQCCRNYHCSASGPRFLCKRNIRDACEITLKQLGDTQAQVEYTGTSYSVLTLALEV